MHRFIHCHLEDEGSVVASDTTQERDQPRCGVHRCQVQAGFSEVAAHGWATILKVEAFDVLSVHVLIPRSEQLMLWRRPVVAFSPRPQQAHATGRRVETDDCRPTLEIDRGVRHREAGAIERSKR